MAQINQTETAKIIRDLLLLAKMAMPADLFTQDSRLIAARAALRELEAVGDPARPPNVTRRTRLDPTTVSPNRPLEMSTIGISFVLDLPWDIVDPLMKAQTDFARLDPSEIVNFALRDWLTGQGYLDQSPETPQA